MYKPFTTLIILGNGFDIAHSIPSGYLDFKKYLQEKYNLDGNDILPDIYSVSDNHGNINVSKRESAKALFYGVESSLDNNWSQFESNLSNMKFGEIIPKLDEFIDTESEEDYSYYLQVYENYINDFSSIVLLWKDIFNEWINQINNDIINSSNLIPQMLFKNLFNNDTFILSFNYTETVEHLYGFNNVLHIHNKIGEDLIWGHGEKRKKLNKYLLDNNLCDEVVLNMYKKNTAKQTRKLKTKLKNLENNIISIYSYGFGYSKVDLIYIKAIINAININSEWHLFDYNNSYVAQEKILRSCGFKGSIYKWN